jgi:hypothetical protein
MGYLGHTCHAAGRVEIFIHFGLKEQLRVFGRRLLKFRCIFLITFIYILSEVNFPECPSAKFLKQFVIFTDHEI